MARLTLTFDPPMFGGNAPTSSIDATETFQTPTGDKLGSTLQVGDAIGFGTQPSWLVIATITPEA
jgi:hypothetical protein